MACPAASTRVLRRQAFVGVAVLIAAGCASPESRPEPVRPLIGSAVQEVSTEYSPALACVAAHARRQEFPPPRIAVGHITDATGAIDYFDGNRVTQGATLMAIAAVAKSGMQLVERFDLGIMQVDLDYTQKQLVRDSPTRLREVGAGQIQGTDLYIVGGITEFNPNIRSRSGDFFGSSGSSTGVSLGLGAKDFMFDVAIDLRLVDSRSTEVLMVRSLRKQLRGYEIEAGILASFAQTVLDLGAGQRRLEPTQTGVRSMIERAVFEFVAALYDLPLSACPVPEGSFPEIDAARAEAAPAHDAPAPRQPAATVASAPPEPSPPESHQAGSRDAAPPPPATAAEPPQSAAVSGGPTIRLATFAQPQNAEALLARLDEMGLPATGAAVSSPEGRDLIAVSIGPFPDQAAADSARSRVEAEIGLDSGGRPDNRPQAAAHAEPAPAKPEPAEPEPAEPEPAVPAPSRSAPLEPAPAAQADAADTAPSPRDMVLAVAATEAEAVERWRAVSEAHPALLGRAQASVRAIEVRGQTAYALVATAAEGTSAPEVCAALTQGGAECAVVP